MWTAAAARGFGLADVVSWMAARPAALAGLAAKGRIAVGADADLVAFDPAASFTVDPDDAAAPAPGHAVRRTHAAGRGAAHLAARRAWSTA